MNFEFFDVQATPAELSPCDLALRDFERQVGALPCMRPACEILRTEIVAAYQHVPPNRAWYVYAGAEDPQRFARKLRRAMIARREVAVSVPRLHDVDLWIGTEQGTAVRV